MTVRGDRFDGDTAGGRGCPDAGGDSGFGGAIREDNTPLIIANSEEDHPNTSGSLSVSSSTFHQNHAGGHGSSAQTDHGGGGAIGVYANGPVSVSTSTFNGTARAGRRVASGARTAGRAKAVRSGSCGARCRHRTRRSHATPRAGPAQRVRVDTFVLGLRSRYDPKAANDVDARYELRIEQEAFEFQVEAGQLTVRRGASSQPDAIIAVIPAAMAAVGRGAAPVRSALSTSAGSINDDVAQFAALFGDLDFGAPSPE